MTSGSDRFTSVGQRTGLIAWALAGLLLVAGCSGTGGVPGEQVSPPPYPSADTGRTLQPEAPGPQGPEKEAETPPDPQRGQENPATADLSAMVQDETRQMYYWLEVATGGNMPCDEPCIRDTSFRRIVTGLVERCEKIEPGAIYDLPAYDANKHGTFVNSLTAACNKLLATAKALGAPRETPEWRSAALQAKSALIPAVEEMRK